MNKIISIFSIISILGIIVCATCDKLISGTLTWSLYSISSIIFVWLVVTPIIKKGKKGITLSLAMFSVLVVPFIFILSKIIGKNEYLILQIGMWVSIISIVYLWIVYLLINKIKLGKFIKASISVLLAIPILFLINYIVSIFIKDSVVDKWDIAGYLVLILLSVIFFNSSYKK